ncbi:AGE family epimerase/isomerase [Roseibium aestuarii]|uniref:AGE family epimerase/isomerase n=1 Tax=Roseibium aestuarii TaxID=2600299 RepID=A0ABW4JZQ9_9HYPH|nr:AGE family epimerase/isomerase [Roseibium aestuarii]
MTQPPVFQHSALAPARISFMQEQARDLLSFFKASLASDAHGASGVPALWCLDSQGQPIPGQPQDLMTTTRLVHSYALGHLAGHPGCEPIIEVGMAALLGPHRDRAHGGFMAFAADGGPAPTDKLAYGHAFVLLAAASAAAVNHPDASTLLKQVETIILEHFWDDEAGLMRDEFRRDWQPFSTYRGMNANMHATEAFLAAYEITGREAWLERAGRILAFFVGEMAPRHGWRIPEHYHADWSVDEAYAGNPMFRPAGTTPGHSFEFARLALQYWDLCGRPRSGLPEAARALTERAMADAWQPGGGLAYTLDFDGKVRIPDRYWWPVTEAIGVYASLMKLEQFEEDARSFERLWQAASTLFIDGKEGGWHPEVDEAGRPASNQFTGKPDIYHALQACLYALTPGLSRPHEGVRGLLLA